MEMMKQNVLECWLAMSSLLCGLRENLVNQKTT